VRSASNGVVHVIDNVLVPLNGRPTNSTRGPGATSPARVGALRRN
jgi:hypothetical protein